MINNFFKIKFLKKNILSKNFCLERLNKIRNIGISAHIDSGKTTFTERVLYYSGKINNIHEVRGSDGVGATMDFMELEREKGITIQSAATFVSWKDYNFNIIDTPGHVDFTIEVERALRVLDGAILLLCASSGVQAQTYTVFKQMQRYDVPRIIFINKLDRIGANPLKVIEQLKSKLKINAEAVQINIGIEEELKGFIDLVEEKAYLFDGDKGNTMKEIPIPEDKIKLTEELREKLIESVSSVDEKLEEMYIMETKPNVQELKDAIRRTTLNLKFSPIFLGSAFKNKGVQPCLDGVIQYLPTPIHFKVDGLQCNYGENIKKEGKKIFLDPLKNQKFVCFAFKLEENKFGQLTYCRVYQGKLKKNDYIYNVREGKRIKVSRMVQMHANKMNEIEEAKVGDIFALFGIECNSGDTFIKNEKEELISLSNMHIPESVLSVKLKLKKKKLHEKLLKALKKFQREDPTFKYNIDDESEELIISGMGELHLEIYVERLKREYEIECTIGEPTVNYRETIIKKHEFNFLHKKQSGGAGQYARIIGYFEPITDNEEGEYSNEFINKTVGNNITEEYITAVEKQFYDSCQKGPLTKYPVVNTRMVLLDGEMHSVDSSSTAFMICAKYCFRDTFLNGNATLLEPIMFADISCPKNNYQNAMASLNKRKANFLFSETRGDLFNMKVEIPLNNMFGFSTELRGFTQGQGEFNMEYNKHSEINSSELKKIVNKIRKERKENS